MLNLYSNLFLPMDEHSLKEHSDILHGSNNNNNNVNDTSDHSICNNESTCHETDERDGGDYLSEWEYLTKTYDYQSNIIDEHVPFCIAKSNHESKQHNMIDASNASLCNQHEQHPEQQFVSVFPLSLPQQQDKLQLHQQQPHQLERRQQNNNTITSVPSQSFNYQNTAPCQQNSNMARRMLAGSFTMQYQSNNITTSMLHPTTSNTLYDDISRSLLPTSSIVDDTSSSAIAKNNGYSVPAWWNQSDLVAYSSSSSINAHHDHHQLHEAVTSNEKVVVTSKIGGENYNYHTSSSILQEKDHSTASKPMKEASIFLYNGLRPINNNFRNADNSVSSADEINDGELLQSSRNTGTSCKITHGRNNVNYNGHSYQHIKELPKWLKDFLESQPELPPCHQHKNEKLLLRPLTPYNYYYREERDNIIFHISDEYDPLPLPVSNFAERRMKDLLYQRWYVDPMKKKRPHRKTHGKMGFQVLSKKIAERWSQLSDEGKSFYRTMARYDDIYYREQLKIVKQEDHSKKK